jgi:hypothetical protein
LKRTFQSVRDLTVQWKILKTLFINHPVDHSPQNLNQKKYFLSIGNEIVQIIFLIGLEEGIISVRRMVIDLALKSCAVEEK